MCVKLIVVQPLSVLNSTSFYFSYRIITLGILFQVINQCSDGGSISPANCLYMDKWLEF